MNERKRGKCLRGGKRFLLLSFRNLQGLSEGGKPEGIRDKKKRHSTKKAKLLRDYIITSIIAGEEKGKTTN